jgi:hypothetical protein
MVRVLPANFAELRHFQTAGRRLLVLGGRVVTVLAIRTLQGNDFAHGEYFLSSLASHLGWQAARPIEEEISIHLTRRDAGHKAPAT